MKKLAVIVACVFMAFCLAAYGDSIILRSVNKDVDLKIEGVTGEYINAVVPKKALKSLNMQFSNTTGFPDTIALTIADVAVECKIKEITDDSIRLLIPTSALSSLQMSFQPGNKQQDAKQPEKVPVTAEKRPKKPKVVVEEEKTEQAPDRVESPVLRDEDEGTEAIEGIRTGPARVAETGKSFRLKAKKPKPGIAGNGGAGLEEKTEEQGLQEIGKLGAAEKLREQDDEEGEVSEEVSALQKAAPDKGVKEGVGEERKGEKPIARNGNLGSVEGRILRSGAPLSECGVKLQMLEKGGVLAKGYRPVAGAMELETVTDKSGLYHFDDVSPGTYKIYWKPPSETSWVRRFKMEPDVIVEAGKLTNPKDIETLKRTLN